MRTLVRTVVLSLSLVAILPWPSVQAADKEEASTVEIIGTLVNWPRTTKEKAQKTFRTKEELNQFWVANGQPKDRPLLLQSKSGSQARTVDFDKEMVVFVSDGEGSDHEKLTIVRVVQDEKAKKAIVEYRRSPINKGTPPGKAYLFTAALVKKAEGTVEFKLLPPEPRVHQPVP